MPPFHSSQDQHPAPVSSQPPRLGRRRIRAGRADVLRTVLFAIIETGAGVLCQPDARDRDAGFARLIMTGQAQNAAFTQAQFKNDRLRQAHRDVRLRERHLDRRAELPGVRHRRRSPTRSTRRKDFRASEQLSAPAGPATSSWCGCSIKWPMFVTGLGFNIANLSGSKRLLTATAAFQNEPFWAMAMKPMTQQWLRLRLPGASHCAGDNSGLAAVEFAMIVPLMLVLFFGTHEFSSGVAVDRKVTLVARTLSDLTSQNTTVTDTQLTNFFNAGTAIMTPYPSSPVEATITELYIDPTTRRRGCKWSKGAAPRRHGRPRRDPGPRCRWRTPI